MLGTIVGKALRPFGYELRKIPHSAREYFPDVAPEIAQILNRVRPYTMTTYDRLAALCTAVEYAVANSIPGAFVECGVWKGGSSMAAALSYQRLKREDVDLYLFDTFEGMSTPGKEDVLQATGEAAVDLLAANSRDAEIRRAHPSRMYGRTWKAQAIWPRGSA